MADEYFFVTHPEVKQIACDEYAQAILDGPTRALSWQGCRSYTVESEDGKSVIQFRSSDGPLHKEIVRLAKDIYPKLVPNMELLGCFDSSTITVWKMNRLPGVMFLELLNSDDTETKLLTTTVDLAE